MQGNLEQKNKMDRIKDLSLDQKAKLYYMGLVKITLMQGNLEQKNKKWTLKKESKNYH